MEDVADDLENVPLDCGWRNGYVDGQRSNYEDIQQEYL